MNRVPPIPKTEIVIHVMLRHIQAVLTSDWLGACCAAFGKQLAKAISAVGFLVAAGKALTSQRNLAMCASEALAMPWVVLVSHSTSCDNLD